MTRYNSRVDDCHSDCVKQLRAFGYTVKDLSRAGEGFPDILISTPFDMWLAEIKGAASLKTFKKTNGLHPSQVKFHSEWKGKPIIIFTGPGSVQAWHMARLEDPAEF